jgi:hypothetical protein
MNKDPVGVNWETDETTLLTRGVCGCSVLVIATTTGAVGTHFSTLNDQQVPAGVDPRDFAADVAGAYTRNCIAGINGMARQGILPQPKAVAFVVKGPVMDRAAERISSMLRDARIPASVIRYDDVDLSTRPDSPVTVKSTYGNMPSGVVFDNVCRPFP